MASVSYWKIEAVVINPDTDEEMEWFECSPGPALRGWLGSWFKPGIGGPNRRVVLRVTYRPTRTAKEARISKNRRQYKAYYSGEYLTLEAATKKMKEDLKG